MDPTTSVQRIHPGALAAAPCALFASLALSAAPAGAEPLVLRNQNPLLAPYGLPSPLPARLPAHASSRVTATMNWANAALLETSAQHALTVDGEFLELRLRFEHGWSPRFAALVELPWRRMGGGSLDGFIDDWHDFFGLPNGDRGQLPRDEMLIRYQRDGVLQLHVDDSGSGIADIPVAFGWQVGASERQALAAWLTVKLPVGDVRSLRGSDAVDVALSLAAQSSFADRWQAFAQLDAVRLGDGELLPRLQEEFVWSALAGLSWNAWRGLDLTVQLQANSRLFDAPGTELAGDAIVLSYGGSYRTVGGWRFDLGMSEDIDVGASPDATFHFAVRRDF